MARNSGAGDLWAEWLAELVDASWVGNAGYRTIIGFHQTPRAEVSVSLVRRPERAERPG